MHRSEKYGEVELSILDHEGYEFETMKVYRDLFGSFSDLLEHLGMGSMIAPRPQAGPGQYELALKVEINGLPSIVHPETVGLGEFSDLFQDRTHPVAPYVEQADLDRIREKLRYLFGEPEVIERRNPASP